MLLPIVAVASLAGLSFLKRRPESNGHAPPGPRTPEERMPNIMAALARGTAASVPDLALAVQEARTLGMAGAAAIFEGALGRALEAERASALTSEASEAPETAMTDATSRSAEEILDVPEVLTEPAPVEPPRDASSIEDAPIVEDAPVVEETTFEVGQEAVSREPSAASKNGKNKNGKNGKSKKTKHARGQKAEKE